MLFSVDAHTIGCHLTGNEVYIRNLLNEYAELDQTSDFIVYVAKPGADESVPRRFTKRWVSDNPFRRLGYDMPASLRRDRPDLLHVQYTGPLFSSVPLIVSVHDVSYLEYPEYFTRFRAQQLRLTVKRSVRQAARILTPSEFSRRAIIRNYGVSGEKVVVVPNAVSSSFRHMQRETAANWVSHNYQIPSPFVLTVGDLQPRKNHLGLIHAFQDLIRHNPQLPHRLVMVGKETWFASHVRRAAEKSAIADRIHFTGWVSDEDVRHFYGACDLFVFPSFYEGFGLPILEAMACGRAVACSNTSAMPEVANLSALLFDPSSPLEITRAMRDVLLDPELRLRMERLGSQRAASFSWSRAARETLDVYYQVAVAHTANAASAEKRTAIPVSPR
jgi:glycosyltransferase involved in cell wall biosynthesis